MADIYNPVARHFNPALAYANQQKAAATGRGSGGSLPVSTARRAIMQGPLSGLTGQSGATTATEALSALGQPDAPSLDAAVDSPDLASLGGGSGPSGVGSAPLGLGSSDSRIASTRGPGESPDTGIAAGAGEQSGQGIVDALGQFGKQLGTKAATGTAMAAASGFPIMESIKAGAMLATTPVGLVASGLSVLGDKVTDYLAHDVYAPARSEEQEAMKGWATPDEQAQHLAQTIERTPVYADPATAFLGMFTEPFAATPDPSQAEALTDLDVAFSMAQEKAGYQPTNETMSGYLGRMNSELGLDVNSVLGMTNPQDEPEGLPELAPEDQITALGMPAQGQATQESTTKGAITGTDYSKGGWAGNPSAVGVHSFAGEDPGYSGGGHASSDTGGISGYGGTSNASDESGGPMGGPSMGGGSAGSSGAASRVICTRLSELGELPRDLYHAESDRALSTKSATTIRGYHAWAVPFVRGAMNRPFWHRIALALAVPFCRHQAGRAGKDCSSRLGWWVDKLGSAACWCIGVCVAVDKVDARWNRVGVLHSLAGRDAPREDSGKDAEVVA